VFSLAAVVHEWLVARRPGFTGEHAAKWVAEMRGSELAPLRPVFARALAASPADRFETAGAFAEALRLACSEPAAPRRSAAVKRERLAKDSDEPLFPFEEAPPDIVLPRQTRIEDLVGEPAVASQTDAAPGEQEPEVVERASASVDEESRTEDEVPEPTVAQSPLTRRNLGADRVKAARPTRRLMASKPPLASDSRSVLLPLALTAVVFLAVGFAAGYGVASRQWLIGADVSLSPEAIAATQDPASIAPVAAASAGTPAAPVSSSAPAAPISTEAADPAPPAAAPVASAAAPPPSSPRPAPPAPPAESRLDIRSTPAGARVLVDGRAVGRTPLTLRGISAGAHTVRLTNDGYAAQDRRVVVTEGRPSQSLNVTLVRSVAPPAQTAAPAGGAPIVVESRPAGASVFLDGRLLGVTPLQVAAIQNGTHAVRLELDGYGPWTTSVRVDAGGKPQRVAASLEAVAPR
jgi:hypothetical protein